MYTISITVKDSVFVVNKIGCRLGYTLFIVLTTFLFSFKLIAQEVLPSPVTFVGKTDLSGKYRMLLGENAFASMRGKTDLVLSDFPLNESQTVNLVLKKLQISSLETRILIVDQQGEKEYKQPEIAMFSGQVQGQAESRVYLGISKFGMRAMVKIAEEYYLTIPSEQATLPNTNAQLHYSYNRKALSQFKEAVELPKCGVSCERETVMLPFDFKASLAAVSSRFAQIALEVDYDYFHKFDDIDLTLDSIFHLFAVVSNIFENDLSVKLNFSFLRIWTVVNDPYSATGGGLVGLHEFQDYWRANHSTPDTPDYIIRNAAHLLSGRSVGAAGNIGQLCKEYGYSISGGSGPPSSFTHDVVFAAHEIGHVFGGIHTHCLDPMVDQCATEPGCNDTVDCGTAPSTLMSYCHNCPGGYSNILWQFHELNIAKMRPNIDACLSLAGSPVYVDWRNTGFENGSVVYPFNTVTEGVESVTSSGSVNINDGNYNESMTIWHPMELNAIGGNVVIGE